MHAEHICQRCICFAPCVNVRRTTHAYALHPLRRTFASSVPSLKVGTDDANVLCKGCKTYACRTYLSEMHMFIVCQRATYHAS